MRISFITRFVWVWLGTLLLTLNTLCTSTAGPKRVLILEPYGRDVAPFSAAVSAFRPTLEQELGGGTHSSLVEIFFASGAVIGSRRCIIREWPAGGPPGGCVMRGN